MDTSTETALTVTMKPAPPPPSKPKEPEPECSCNTIFGAEDIVVYPGKRGHVIIKQHDDEQHGGYAFVFIQPRDVPKLVELLQLAAEAAASDCEIHQ
jgi:hypothetical protein